LIGLVISLLDRGNYVVRAGSANLNTTISGVSA
jgi:hypothetical protein